MTFWLIAAGIAACAAWVLLAPLRAPVRATGASTDAGDSADMRIYRDQLAEVERDLARGTLDAAEATRLRTEVQRRLLDADRAHQQDVMSQGVPLAAMRGLLVALPLALIGGALALYLLLGSPGAQDFSMADRLALAQQMEAERPSQAAAVAAAPDLTVAEGDADPQFVDLMIKLRAAVADRPDDLEGQVLLARNEAILGRYDAAASAQARVVALKGDTAQAADFAEQAGLMILAANGLVTPEAEQVLIRALQLDPTDGVARYYAGLLHVQVGRPDRAFEMWRALLEAGPADAPWNPPIRAQIGDLAAAAGVNYAPPPLAPARPEPSGPSAEDMAAAADMSPEDRQQMIRGMVDGLSDRLATQGGPASDWARLITALGVLGETDRAAAIWAEAQQVFSASADALTLLRQSAAQAGIAQ
jgi:cytochrome c-type biogenesis protein CcmH